MKNNKPNTHYFPNHIFLGVCTIFIFVVFAKCNSSTQKLKSSDWKLGIESYSFHLNTFADALDKIEACGVKYAGAFPEQKIGNGIKGTLDYHMSTEKRKAIKKMLAAHKIEMVSYGVVTPKTEADWIKLFKFADAMGLQNVSSEPRKDQIPFVSKLADKYKINVAIHNHAKPTRYWNPEIVLNAIKGVSPRIGVCADVGHWFESGLGPIECLKKLKGHVIEFHMKDESKKAGEIGAHVVPMGQGAMNMDGIMKQMRKQEFKGFVFIEYEYHFKNNVNEVKQCVEYFREEKKKLFQ